ncbi:hypothetical protein WELLINGTON_29 [Erwinia phage Wellington]|uniref:Uncharacterized protein n=2 Tax=Wellingtonvirus wellington TaxID=2734153 RepID=A0A1B2IDP4_9CAUD|nr:hypothetical protein BIZ80_gp270 [Erwinia phage vB_EamM_Kwan]YP_009806513.1 hypothetical protein HOT70_gp272 [Erwinia phage Wellington]ANZ49381.1 hypothetical protein KWAN_29 [Erwinia phage vB_EamM_Kwan]AXF51160.1 hypothetical protein WELLINGTON_29 [Erwinia phage Wellington]
MLSKKIETHIRNSVEQYLNKLRSCPGITRVDCEFDGKDGLVMRAVHEVNTQVVKLTPAEMEHLTRTAYEYVAAKGFPQLGAVYEEKVRVAALEYASQGVQIKEVVLRGDAHPFRVTYLAKQ